jgi:outer membrane receptor for ferric coprogen and ferric-rhodotorulic acid
MFGYHLDENFTAQLNINNLFNKEYYEGIGSNTMNYGPPRSFTLAMKYRF